MELINSLNAISSILLAVGMVGTILKLVLGANRLRGYYTLVVIGTETCYFLAALGILLVNFV